MLTQQSTVVEKSTNLFEVCEYNQRWRFLGLCHYPHVVLNDLGLPFYGNSVYIAVRHSFSYGRSFQE